MILAKDLKHRGIVIDPQVNDPKEQVSIDLSVGDVYQKSGDKDWRSIDGSLTIAPGTCVLVRTKEFISMPNNAFGLLSSKGSLGAKGLIIANTKLDPLFNGHLNIPVFNVGNKKVTIMRDKKYCSLSFWTTEHPIIGNETRHAIKIEPREVSIVRDFLSNNASNIITGMVSVLSAIAAAIVTVGFGS